MTSFDFTMPWQATNEPPESIYLAGKIIPADLAEGVRCHSMRCPFVLALSRVLARKGYKFPTQATIYVDHLSVLWLPTQWVEYTATTPDEVRDFILKYDMGGPVAGLPIPFRLHLRQWS